MADTLTAEEKLEKIREQSAADDIYTTPHAQAAMVEEDPSFLLDDVRAAIASPRAQILEDYPTDPRGPSALVLGWTPEGRPVHVVCTTARPTLILITVYEPKPPWWVTPTERGRR